MSLFDFYQGGRKIFTPGEGVSDFYVMPRGNPGTGYTAEGEKVNT